MNPVVAQLVNGNAFFIGLGITVIAFLLPFWWSSRVANVVLAVAWLLGICLVILSATPIEPWFYALWLTLCIVTRIKSQIPDKSKTLIAAAFVLFSVTIFLAELPYHLAKSIPVSKTQTVYVIGDSISAGIGEKEKTWPSVLGDLSQLKVVNLARPGATLEMSLYQSRQINTTNSLALVEIGGNDLLGHTDSHTFYVQLNNLLRDLKGKNAQIVMFELPLLPLWNDFGRAQRILAKRYDAILIPKSYLVSAFAGKDNTIDGLHLSQKGHDELAAEVWGLMKIGP